MHLQYANTIESADNVFSLSSTENIFYTIGSKGKDNSTSHFPHLIPSSVPVSLVLTLRPDK